MRKSYHREEQMMAEKIGFGKNYGYANQGEKALLKVAVALLGATGLMWGFLPYTTGISMSITLTSAPVFLLTAVALLVWISRRDFRKLMRYVLAVTFSLFSIWSTMNFWNWMSVSKHGDIGAGGGYSIGMGSIYVSIWLCISLLLSLAVQQVMGNSERRWQRVLNAIPLMLLGLWAAVVLYYGSNI